jgi:hypothetical protein
LFAKS